MLRAEYLIGLVLGMGKGTEVQETETDSQNRSCSWKERIKKQRDFHMRVFIPLHKIKELTDQKLHCGMAIEGGKLL